MDDIIDDAICLGAATILELLCDVGLESPQRAATSSYLQERSTKGRFAKDFDDLAKNTRLFKENFRMNVETFELLHRMVEPYLLPKKNTRPKDFISTKQKLAIPMEYFACGTLQRHISSIYRISKQHFGVILEQVSDAICVALKNEILNMTAETMLTASQNFLSKWNFPNCVGAVDGKHVAIRCPKKSGSLFYNYKGFFSIVLMAVVDANYKFTYVDIGAYGSEGDASIFVESTLGCNIFLGSLKFPLNSKVGSEDLPYFFVGDDAFPLNERIMKPYAPPKGKQLTQEESVFNYRLSRARRCVENAFGILCSRFYCLARTMFCGPRKSQKIIAACCYLHNFLMRVNHNDYSPPNYEDTYDSLGQVVNGGFRANIPETSMFNSEYVATNIGNYPMTAKMVRENLKVYVNSESGSIPWQFKAAHLN